jgi:histidyl-tRNA synthetase
LAAEAEGVISADGFVADLFIIPLGESAMVKTLKIAMAIRSTGKVVEIAFGERGLKGAMKAADKSGARYVVVLGDDEIATKSVELKDMNSGVSTSVTIDSLINAL